MAASTSDSVGPVGAVGGVGDGPLVGGVGDGPLVGGVGLAVGGDGLGVGVGSGVGDEEGTPNVERSLAPLGVPTPEQGSGPGQAS